MASILAFFFELLSRPTQIVMETSYIAYVLMYKLHIVQLAVYVSLPYLHTQKENNASVTYFLKFTSIFLKFIHSTSLSHF